MRAAAIYARVSTADQVTCAPQPTASLPSRHSHIPVHQLSVFHQTLGAEASKLCRLP